MKRKTQSIGTPAKRRPSGDAKNTPLTPGTGKGRKRPQKLEISAYSSTLEATRLLSCGQGEQLGHPGRNTTRKPRAVDTFPAGTKFVQAVAGGVHSLVLTPDGTIYSCGVNEKGTVPVKGLELEELTDEFTEIEFSPLLAKLGKPVQIAAGASFSAALTAKGSVIAWGNLRDTQGELTIHETLSEIQKAPVVIIRHHSKVIVKIAAGENHLVMLSDEGEVLTFGEGSVGQLGRSVRTEHIRSSYMVDDSGKSLLLRVLEKNRFLRFVDVFACGFWTIAKASDGRLFACGLNNFCQLGIQDDPKSSPEKALPGDNSSENASNSVGQEHGSKVSLLTHTNAFPSTKNWTHIAGGQHIVCRNDDGEVWAIGKNTDNTLGLGTWTGNKDNEHWRYVTLQQVIIPDGEKAAGVTASLGTSIVWTNSGKAYAFGCDTVGQLGLGITDLDDKVVSTPRLVRSAHLDHFKIVSVSLADNHALFLATPHDDESSPMDDAPPPPQPIPEANAPASEDVKADVSIPETDDVPSSEAKADDEPSSGDIATDAPIPEAKTTDAPIPETANAQPSEEANALNSEMDADAPGGDIADVPISGESTDSSI